jgi:1-deoxy-D-xylulose-5-phosphate reductoisomerase
MKRRERVTVLGSTGSIGLSTLDVVSHHPERFELFALTANEQVDALFAQCLQYRPRYAVLRDGRRATELRARLQASGSDTEVLEGDLGFTEVAASDEVDTVVAAIVGAAGLEPTLAAVSAGKKVLLANKESLVMAGQLFMNAVTERGATLLPVDSEHNAIFQCLPQSFGSLAEAGVRKILLTGSGGPFRLTDPRELSAVTPDQACAHPNWSMGRKISVDSATMMNKGLEFIEACWLFRAKPRDIEVVVHPQSVVHSMVEYLDGSVIAQLGNPDMRTPIAHCLAWPERIESRVPSLNFRELGQLEFSAPDYRKFRCLQLAVDAMEAGGTAPTALNAANEIAVESFLAKRIKFTQISELNAAVMDNWPNEEPASLAAVKEADRRARAFAAQWLTRI